MSKAVELYDADPSFVSLVDAGANRTPFKILKQETPPEEKALATLRARRGVLDRLVAALQRKQGRVPAVDLAGMLAIEGVSPATVSAVVFDAGRYTAPQASAWAATNGFTIQKLDTDPGDRTHLVTVGTATGGTGTPVIIDLPEGISVVAERVLKGCAGHAAYDATCGACTEGDRVRRATEAVKAMGHCAAHDPYDPTCPECTAMQTAKAAPLQALARLFADDAASPVDACRTALAAFPPAVADAIATQMGATLRAQKRARVATLVDKARTRVVASVTDATDMDRVETALDAVAEAAGEDAGMELKDVAAKLDAISTSVLTLVTRVDALDAGQKAEAEKAAMAAAEAEKLVAEAAATERAAAEKLAAETAATEKLAAETVEKSAALTSFGTKLDEAIQLLMGLGERVEKIERTALVRKGGGIPERSRTPETIRKAEGSFDTIFGAMLTQRQSAAE